MAQDEKVAEAVRALVGPDAEVCVNRHNMMVVKAPRVGRQIDWHQDGVNWGHARMVSFMVFLDDASVENGCLEIVPGAHKYGLFPTVQTSVGEGMNVQDPLQAALLRQAVPLCAQAGEGLFFHSCLPHFSKANGSDRYRRNLTFAYVAAADKTAAAGGMAPLESLPLTIERTVGINS
ncbi:MAG: phytanoyl-CoA dioxygenase family protein [Planctomycetes bacterium]|nr:phytanoyl-CoA dioxygenase family protein [Planctomycetota bacterium]